MDKHIVTKDRLQGLPEPVQRYMDFTGVVGKPWIQSVRVTMTGRFRTGMDRPWMPMMAVQSYTTNPLSFRWDARFKLFGLPLLRARDIYAGGHGHMFAKLGGLFTLFDVRGEELDQGAMLRYLSETIWFPTVLLGDKVTWEALDSESAKATLHDDNRSVSGTFFFDDEGRPVNFSAMRYREVEGDFIVTPWSTPMMAYGQRAGLNLPVQGQAMWHLDEGAMPYVILEIGEIVYDQPG